MNVGGGAKVGSGREQHVRDPIELDLDCGLLIFEDGEWRLHGGDVGAKGSEANVRDVQELKQQKKRLEEENNMLKYKMEVLIDMLAVAELDRKKMEDKLERRQMTEKTSTKPS